MCFCQSVEAFNIQLDTLRSLHVSLKPGSRVLDFGCAYGDGVQVLLDQGFDAWGTDIVPYWDGQPHGGWEGNHQPTKPHILERVRVATLEPYRLPYEDASFDAVISQGVFEHVMDFPSAFREIARVLKPGGVSLHIFPARIRPIEAHVYVPLSEVIRTPLYMGFWALMGVRNEFQREMPWREVRDRNIKYLNEECTYPTERRIRRWGKEAGVQLAFVERTYARHRLRTRFRTQRATPQMVARTVGGAFIVRAMVLQRELSVQE